MHQTVSEMQPGKMHKSPTSIGLLKPATNPFSSKSINMLPELVRD